MLRHDTTATLSEDRVRRLRELLVMMVDRYGDQAQVVVTLRRNLAHAEEVLAGEGCIADQYGQDNRGQGAA